MYNNSTFFTYDGVRSIVYGLMVADFNSQNIGEITAYNATLHANKVGAPHRFMYNGLTFDDMPEQTISVISEYPISDTTRREILRWLVGRKGFKRLIVHKPDLADYYFNCVFTNANIIYVNGVCHGFRLTARFDSIYARKSPTVLELTGNGLSQTVTISNISDIVDDYVYPTVDFTSAATVDGKNIRIINNTDSPTRAFEFTGLSTNERIIVDNEAKIITSSTTNERVSKFNKNWLRMRRGDNSLTVVINGSVTITCPSYILIGF